ncbi:MAG TPA: hypothetical protein ACFYEA_08235 [Candidatus Tripitaka californicus]|uniref:hypothetical protein n=1 Tax=Candidatus Tripitaka californicus TaxID=3367616 RepID=UPI0040252A2A|nr:hypothetical protein [Planctomycetota bacterium]
MTSRRLALNQNGLALGAEPQCYSPGAPPPGLTLHQINAGLEEGWGGQKKEW